MQWERSSVETTTQYKAFMSQEIKAKVGVNIGLRGINVTLKGMRTLLSNILLHKVVNLQLLKREKLCQCFYQTLTYIQNR